jgi:hypothetical protein
LSDVLTKPKAKPKRRVERFEFGDDVVELRQVDPDKREAAPDNFMSGPAQRSKWEVHINDVHRGYVFYPLGVGNPWIGCLLEPKQLVGYDGEDGVRCWLGPTGEHGGWSETGGMWDGLLGLLKRLEAPDDLKRRSNSTYGFKDRASAAEAFARAFRAGKVPHGGEVEKKIAAEQRRIAERKRQDAADQARYARERADREAQERRDATAAEEARQEVLAGLASIQERFNGQLSNLEAVALTRAIERYSKS